MTSPVSGQAGSVRIASLKIGDLRKMQNHEKRLDVSGRNRHVRNVAPLVYSDGQIDIAPPSDEDGAMWGSTLVHDYERHVAGARRNKAADAVALHAFVQFPTGIPINSVTEKLMLQEAVAFVERVHGGKAVFHARLDRDEEGRHGVDVFYAPKYDKVTGKGDTKKTVEWVSLTKFGKALAAESYGGSDGNRNQGRALQDAWFEYLRDDIKIKWVQRGNKKLTNDPDRLSPELFKLKKDREKLKEQNSLLNRRQLIIDNKEDDLKLRHNNIIDMMVSLSSSQLAASDAQREAEEERARAKAERDKLVRQRQEERELADHRRKEDAVRDYVTQEMFSGRVLTISKNEAGRASVVFNEQVSPDFKQSFFAVVRDFLQAAIETAARWRTVFDALNVAAADFPKVLEKVAPLVQRPSKSHTRDGMDF